MSQPVLAQSNLTEASGQITIEQLIEQGFKKYLERDLSDALSIFNEVIRLDPTNPQGYIGRGSILSDQGDDLSAIEDYTQALRLDPSKYVKLHGFSSSLYYATPIFVNRIRW